MKVVGKSIKEITSDIYRENNRERKVAILTKINGVGIPIASAILSVCYPNDFTISDYRVVSALNRRGNTENLANPSSSIPSYSKYLDLCIEVAKRENVSLRDLDRCLWGYDFYEGKSGLKELVSVYK